VSGTNSIGEAPVAVPPPQPWDRVIRGLGGGLQGVARPVVASAFAVIVGGIIMLVLGDNPLTAYGILFAGAFQGRASIFTTLQFTTPLIFTGLAVAFSFRAGIWNIGAEGQMLFGAFFAAEAGYMLRLPAPIHLPVAFLCGMVGAVLWALIPGLLRALLGINELVVCLMLNPMALLLTSYLSDYPFKAPGPTNKTYDIQPTAQLAQLTPYSQLNAGIFLAVAMAVLLLAFWGLTARGYEFKMIGLNVLFARYGGLNVARGLILAMVISGAIAGMAGSEEALGVYHAYYDGFSPGYGNDGIAIAMLAKNNPLGVVVAALLLGALNSGGQQLQMQSNITKDLVTLLQAVIIFFLAAEFSYTRLRLRRKGREVAVVVPAAPHTAWDLQEQQGQEERDESRV